MGNSWEKFGLKESEWLESVYQGIVTLIGVAKLGGDGISYTDFLKTKLQERASCISSSFR